VPFLRSPALAALSLLMALAVVPAIDGRQPPTLPSLLTAAASYVAGYEERASFFLFEERYVQSVQTQGPSAPPGSSRTLRSEVAVVNTPDFGWIGFRDVFEVDGRPVGNRQDRLEALFSGSLSSETLSRARMLADESARYNLGSVQRTVNYPTMALVFLREANQSRSTFAREDSARVNGVPTWMVAFEETARPTLVGSQLEESRGDVGARGRFWVEPDSGRVRKSEITLGQTRSIGTIEVEYGPWPGLDLLVPSVMRETFVVKALSPQANAWLVQVIRGEARYSNVRQFKGTARIKNVAIQP
jgi:hypothetical protein